MLYTPLPQAWPVPVIQTPRLRLRAHTLADFEDYCALWAEPEVVRFIGVKPSTPEETWSRMLRHAGHWTMLGFGSWLIEEKATGDMVGETGIFDYRRSLEPVLTMPEMGWILSPAKQGRGFATEAAQAVLDWAQGRFEAEEIACIVSPENASSLRVAAKCGFAEYARSTYRDSSIVMLKRQL